MFERPTITLVQFRLTPAAARLELQSLRREMAPWADVVAVSAFAESVHDNMLVADGVVLGGSGDLDFDGARSEGDAIKQQTRQLVERLASTLDMLFERNSPLFGICFGHQLLGAFHGVTVYHDPGQSKQKTHTVILNGEGQDHRLCRALPQTFDVQYGHKDVLSHVPTGATLLAHGGEVCRVSALAYSDTILSTQFHPELTLDDLYDRVTHIPSYLPDGVGIAEIYRETPHAPTLLHNFARLVAVDGVGRRIGV